MFNPLFWWYCDNEGKERMKEIIFRSIDGWSLLCPNEADMSPDELLSKYLASNSQVPTLFKTGKNLATVAPTSTARDALFHTEENNFKRCSFLDK